MFNDLTLNSLLNNIFTILKHQNSPEELILLLVVEVLFWTTLSIVLIMFLPKKYRPFRKDIFIFFTVINIGLLFIGVILTLIMIIFGLSWATHRVSRPHYEAIKLEDEIAKFPIVYSKFQEGILTMEGKNRNSISSDNKIKSLKILYDSNAQGNIGKIKKFLSDNSDETRLYAFALVSTFEKKLNDRITELQEKINSTDKEDIKNFEKYNFELANTYWQFIFHGVADEQLLGFYTQKIENILKNIEHQPNAYILLGKIHLINHKYMFAEDAFFTAIKLGIPKKAMATFLAEVKFGKREYNRVAPYILPDQFNLDLRLKPLIDMWIRT